MMAAIIQINKRITASIGRVEATLDGRLVLGTAFLVGSRYALTAYHVVGDRRAFATGGSKIFARQIVFTPSGTQDRITATVIPDCADGNDDWALLELTRECEARPLPLGDPESADKSLARQYASWGYPTVAALAGGGIVLEGHVRNWDAQYQGAQAMELHCDFAAAGNINLQGLSGAPCIIDGAAVGIIRSNLIAPNGEPGIVGATVYACPISSLNEKCWTKVPPPSWEWGLPGLPASGALPAKPFRDLRWYEEEHGALFCGRGAEIRDLYERLTGDQVPRLVLVYGHSGVGKSSLLRAGLSPRLRASMALSFGYRVKGQPLPISFDALLQVANARAGESGHRPLVLFDQIEEVYAESTKIDGDAELTQLLQRVKHALAGNDSLRVLLSFRAEWLAQMKTASEKADIAVAYVHVLPMGAAGIQEVVRGIRRQPMRDFYRMGVDDALPQAVAQWLLSDRNSPISPMLSIVMTRLWERAENSEVRSLSLLAFQNMVRDKLDLDTFTTNQLLLVGDAHGREVESGLVLDMLHQLTTEHGTTQPVSLPDLERAYAHGFPARGKEGVRMLLVSLEGQALIYTTRQTDGTPVERLAHDTLATPIRKHFALSVRAGQRARRILESRIKAAGTAQADPFDETDLRVVKAGISGMRALDQDESDLMARSERKQGRVKLGRAIFAGLMLLAVTALGGLWYYSASQDRYKGQEYFARALSFVSAKEFLAAELLLAHATKLDDQPRYRDALLDARLRAPHRRMVVTMPTTCRRVLAVGPDGLRAACVGGIPGETVTVTIYSLEGEARDEQKIPLKLRVGDLGDLRGEFSANGSVLVVAGDSLLTWITLNGNLAPDLTTQKAGLVTRMAVCRDDASLVVVAAANTLPRLVERTGGEPLEFSKAKAVEAIAFNAGCSRVSLALEENVIENWKLDDGAWVRAQNFTRHTDVVRSLTYDKDDLIVSGGYDATIRRSSPTTGDELSRIVGTGDVSFVALSNSGRRVLTRSYNQSLHIWETSGGQPIIRIHQYDEKRGGVGPRAEGGTRTAGFVAGREDRIYLLNGALEVEIWDLANARDGMVLHEAGTVAALAFHPTRKNELISGGDDEPDSRTETTQRRARIKIWNLDKRAVVNNFESRSGPIQNLYFMSNGSHVVASDVRLKLHVWDAETRQAKDKLTPNIESGWGLAVVPSLAAGATEHLLVSNPKELMLSFWDVDGYRVDRTLTRRDVNAPGKEEAWTAVALFTGIRGAGNVQRSLLVMGSDYLTFMDANPASRVVPKHFDVDRGVYSLAINKEKTTVAAGSSSRQLRLFDVQDVDNVEAKDPLPWRHDGTINSVTYCGPWLVSAGSDGVVRLSDASNPARSIPVQAHMGPSWWVTCNPDETLVASGGTDGTIRILNIKLLQETMARTPGELIEQAESNSHLTVRDGNIVLRESTR